MAANPSTPGLFDEPPRRRAAPAAQEAAAGPRRYSVGELTGVVAARLLELGRVSVEGEIAGLKRASSGHVYFDLKDRSARLSCVVWASGVRRALAAMPKDGDLVAATGKLDVYAPRGSYSLVVENLEPVGVGVLLAKLEALKQELAARGWFARRRPLPAWPRTVGVVTSRDGAALRDFLRTRSLRWPAYPLRLVHAPVQGPGASAALAAALTRLAASGVDVIVLTRGGGSLEDLWAFNEEPLARAIWECPVPVVSGVGHESDTTLVDMIADVRAHTPTDAAVCVFPDRAALVERLERGRGYLVDALERALERRAERLERLARVRVLAGAGWILGERGRALEHLRRRLIAAARAALENRAGGVARVERRLVAASPRAKLERWERRLGRLGRALVARGQGLVEPAERRLAHGAGSLHALSPLAVLARGYSITRTADGRSVRDVEDVHPGDFVDTRLVRGAFRSRVETIAADGADSATDVRGTRPEKPR